MQDPAERRTVAINVWTARIIPIILAGVVGYATYVLVALLCVNYLLVKHNDKSAAIPILVIYFILFSFMAASFFRLVHITMFDPPYVPLGPAASANTKEMRERKSRVNTEENVIGGVEYALKDRSGRPAVNSQSDPDFPGLELFYTKDVFVAEMDGRPRWCSYCCNYKPDRTHHCSSSGRCIKKMDHFCPWVGGPVGETNYKFFLQFNGYTALYCLHLLIVMAIYISRQKRLEGERMNRQFAAILGLAAFFGLFTAGMIMTALGLAARNLTQVENLGRKTRVHTLAVIKPAGTPSTITPIIDSQSSYAEITYPLMAKEPMQDGQGTWNRPANNESSEHYDASHSQVGLANDLSGAASPLSGTRGREPLTERDLNATRTFAVLRLNQGDNPWDLGSVRRNLQTVMGNSMLDWFLPIQRSPCCNHDSSESQFEIGPVVDQVRCNFGLMALKDMRPLPRK